MTDWTVYVEASDWKVTDDDVARIGADLVKELPGAVMAPAPVLGCRVTLDEVLPTRALAAVQGAFELAAQRALRRRRVAEEREVGVTRVEMAQGADLGWVPRKLVTAKGLARRVGITPAWVRMRMKYEGHPRPVDVEGGTEAVYDLEEALEFLSKVSQDA
ncbi:hypothetical protein ACPCSE_29205 [Streptomyces cellulosae]